MAWLWLSVVLSLLWTLLCPLRSLLSAEAMGCTQHRAPRLALHSVLWKGDVSSLANCWQPLKGQLLEQTAAGLQESLGAVRIQRT